MNTYCQIPFSGEQCESHGIPTQDSSRQYRHQLGLAWLISQLKEKAQTFFKAVYYLPAVASGVTVSLIWLWIFDPHPVGLLNKFIGLFGFDNVLWLGSSKTALFSLMLMTYLGGHGELSYIYRLWGHSKVFI